jgi:hypothetical protein
MAQDGLAGENAETLAFINTELASLADRQAQGLDRIDTKAVLVVGYALAAVSFLATRKAELVLAVLAYAAFAVAAGFGLASVAIRKYKEINPRSLFNKYWDKPVSAVAASTAAIRVKHYEYNAGQLEQKVRQWRIGVVALLAGTALMTGAVVAQTYQHDHAQRPGQRAIQVRHQGSGRPTSGFAAIDR